MKNFILSASILSADFCNLKVAIQQCEQAGCDWIHVDVMDGHFVPNITMGPFIVEACKKMTSLPLDVHLMIENPELFIEPFIKAGASILTIHIEDNLHVRDSLKKIRDSGVKPGIAINPETPASSIEPIIDLVDMVLVMTVHPGYSGQSFMPEVVKKIATVSSMAAEKNPSMKIQVDGGITSKTMPLCIDAGANAFVAATAIFKHPAGIKAGIDELHSVMV
jgi:ribulose-phosphate 3-epimerase